MIVFTDEIYPPAEPLQFGAWPATSGCPNAAGLQAADELPAEVVVHGVSELLYTGHERREMAVSDRALWPLIPFDNRAENSGPTSVDESWIDSLVTVNESDYAGIVRNQCGELIAEVSWVAKVCPGPCAENPSESLKDDLFFILREDHWLIWAIY